MKNFINVRLQNGKEVFLSVGHIFSIESSGENTCNIGVDVQNQSFQIFYAGMSADAVLKLIKEAQ
jgi:hypothetical protein